MSGQNLEQVLTRFTQIDLSVMVMKLMCCYVHQEGMTGSIDKLFSFDINAFTSKDFAGGLVYDCD